MEKHKITVILSGKNGYVLDSIEVFTTDPEKTVLQISNAIENNHWTDESDFDAYLLEHGEA